jgi:hypothetical protein
MALDLNNQQLLSAYHISSQLSDYESARSGFFTFIVGVGSDDETKTINGIEVSKGLKTPAEASEYLQLNVTKASVPHFSLEVLEYKRGNEKVKFAGIPSFESGSIVVDDVVGLDTKSILLAWQALAYDVHTGKGGRMKDYKFDCQLVEYTQDYSPIRTWDLKGCWISELSEDDFDKESDGKRQITATIQYDKAIPHREAAYSDEPAQYPGFNK